MRKHLTLLLIASESVFRHKARSLVVMACLIAVLLPFITAIAISEGVKAQSLISVEEGADLYLTLDQFGRNGPIPLTFLEKVQKISGVLKVVPRAIGRAYLGDKLVVILGISPADLPGSIKGIKGRLFLPGTRNEVVVGNGLARYYQLAPGDSFIFPLNRDKVFKVVGIFSADSSIWSSDLVLMSLEDGAELFQMKGMASDFLIYCRPGYEGVISKGISWLGPLFRIQSKDLVRQYYLRGFTLKEGIFTALYTVAFALAIPALLVASGLGLSERRREIGVLKATGWQTQEVLEMVFFESLIISLTSAPLALLTSIFWVKALNGLFIAQFFIAEIGIIPDFPVPARFTPVPALLSLFFALILTAVGSIYSAWKAATVPPVEAMRW